MPRLCSQLRPCRRHPAAATCRRCPVSLPLQEPNAESRAAVQSGNPLTPAGRIPLDPEPDVREVLLLADELKLDEVLAVLCVQGALQEVRSQLACSKFVCVTSAACRAQSDQVCCCFVCLGGLLGGLLPRHLPGCTCGVLCMFC